MKKILSPKFFLFLIFILLVIGIAGFGLYVAWQTKTENGLSLDSLRTVLPLFGERKDDLNSLLAIGRELTAQDNQERTFLLLFQNSWELRPGGGFIGAFGILKLKNGNILSLDIFDTGVFDQRISDGGVPPYPLSEYLYIKSWNMRDSNFSPSFIENAQKAEHFYRLGQGEESIDGVIGITTNVLVAALDISGPIEVPGYPGTFSAEDGIYQLEYQVEKGFVQQNIPRLERKSVMRDLAQAILAKLSPFTLQTLLDIYPVVLTSLEQKDIQLYFKDSELQDIAQKQGWAGVVDSESEGDYLFIVDANLLGFKSDSVIERSLDYTVDFSQDSPQAALAITYRHNGLERNWLIREYRTYVRVYVPEGSWFTQTPDAHEVRYGKEFNKSVVGTLVEVPIGEEKTAIFTYTLPERITPDSYALTLQKQAGVNNIPFTITVIYPDGDKQIRTFDLNVDSIVKF